MILYQRYKKIEVGLNLSLLLYKTFKFTILVYILLNVDIISNTYTNLYYIS